MNKQIIPYRIFTAKDEHPDCDKCMYELSFEEDSICCTHCGSEHCWEFYRRQENESDRTRERQKIIKDKRVNVSDIIYSKDAKEYNKKSGSLYLTQYEFEILKEYFNNDEEESD